MPSHTEKERAKRQFDFDDGDRVLKRGGSKRGGMTTGGKKRGGKKRGGMKRGGTGHRSSHP